MEPANLLRGSGPESCRHIAGAIVDAVNVSGALAETVVVFSSGRWRAAAWHLAVPHLPRQPPIAIERV